MDEQEPFEVVVAVADDEVGIHSIVGHFDNFKCTFGHDGPQGRTSGTVTVTDCNFLKKFSYFEVSSLLLM